MELNLYHLNIFITLKENEIPEISEKTRSLDVCKDVCNSHLVNQPVDSLKTRASKFKTLTEDLAEAEKNPKKWVIIYSLLLVIATAATIAFTILSVVFISAALLPSATLGLTLFGCMCPSLALGSFIGAIASSDGIYCASTKIRDLKKQLETSQNSLIEALQKHEECAKALKIEIKKEILQLTNTTSTSLSTYNKTLKEIEKIEEFLKNLKETATTEN